MFKKVLLRSVRFLINWVKDNVLNPLLGKLIVGLFSLVVILSALAIVTFEHLYDFQDEDGERGATTVQQDIFGDDARTIMYLDQGWGPADSLWFYKTPLGSNMLPYDFFMALEQIGTLKPFRSNENINIYRYLPQKPTSSNPDSLPVGFVKETYKGKDFIGLTCAACHTAQINYKDKGIRIDGGPAMADMESFVRDLARALYATQQHEDVRERFVHNVLARGFYKTETEVLADLDKYRLHLVNYITINYSTTHYGYARLDAFGRISNRILEHILDVKELKEFLRDPRVTGGGIIDEKELESLLSSADTLKALAEKNNWESLVHLRRIIFKPPNAPVSYPFLWDASYHDYLKWNGQASNAELGPINRNAGEAIGAFASLDWSKSKSFSLSSLAAGRGPISFTTAASSINIHNLLRIEEQLKLLKSPLWPEDILPPIDKSRIANGRSLFNKHCISCHAPVVRDDPRRRIVAHMSKVSDVGTDLQMAKNSQSQGLSGILRNQYAPSSVGDILLDRQAPMVALMTKITQDMVNDASSFTKPVWYVINGAHSLVYKLFGNEIKPSVKRGDYTGDSGTVPFASLQSYKARSLNGIWATAPYLHNGSVPTLYDLLLPKKRPGDPEDGEYRPDEFEVGSREFDPVKVGFKSSGYGGFMFKTGGIKSDIEGYIRGNSNAGHEYGARRVADESRGFVDQQTKDLCSNEEIKEKDLDLSAAYECLYPMSRSDRFDLLEYLKTL